MAVRFQASLAVSGHAVVISEAGLDTGERPVALGIGCICAQRT
jgi:hypothetical protein